MPTYTTGQAQTTPLRDFAPDLPPDTPGVILDGENIAPTMKGYATRNSPATFAPALPGFDINIAATQPIGGFIATFSDGTQKVFAANATTIYRLDAGAWVQAGSGYNATSRWRFTQFADDVVAVAKGVMPQAAQGASGTFVSLMGSPPNNSEHAITVASTVFMTQGTNWANSAIGTDNNWTPDLQTQAATGVLTDFPGDVTGLAALFRSPIIFKEASMLRGDLVGGTSIWDFQLLSDETGAAVQEGIIELPEALAFLGRDDFYLCAGYAPQRIPNSLKEWFFAEADRALLNKMLSWYDLVNSVCYWHFVSRSPARAGVPDRYVAFNQRVGRWAPGRLTTYYVIPHTQPNFTDGLFFDENGELKTWTGTPGAAWLLTSYLGLPGALTQVMRGRFTYDTYPTGQTTPTVPPEVLIPLHTSAIGVPDQASIPAVLGADKWHYFRQHDRYHRCRLETSGSMEVCSFAYEARIGGAR